MLDETIRKKLADRNVAEVARRIGVTRAYLNNYLSTGKISASTKEKLIAYLLEN